MSRYVVLIAAQVSPEPPLYALTTSSNPEVGLTSLQAYSPVPCELIHAIEGNSRTDDLERTLQIKYKALRSHSFWYRLTEQDVIFIKDINRDNLMRVTGLIKRQLAPPPNVNGVLLPDYITELQKRCNRILSPEKSE